MSALLIRSGREYRGHRLHDVEAVICECFMIGRL